MAIVLLPEDYHGTLELPRRSNAGRAHFGIVYGQSSVAVLDTTELSPSPLRRTIFRARYVIREIPKRLHGQRSIQQLASLLELHILEKITPVPELLGVLMLYHCSGGSVGAHYASDIWRDNFRTIVVYEEERSSKGGGSHCC